MTKEGKLSKPELFISLPISLLLIGVSLWNWFHGVFHILNWFWLLIGLNRLVFLAHKLFPKFRGVLQPLVYLTAFSLILLAAVTALSHFW